MITKFGGLQKRIQAFAYDYLIILAYLGGVILVSFGLDSTFPPVFQKLTNDPYTGQFTGFLTVTLPVSLYFIFMESSDWKATWGKKMTGLKVLREDATKLTRLQSISRTAMKFIPWELAHACIWHMRFSTEMMSPFITAGYILIWILIGANIYSLWRSPKNQTLYDLLSKTVVVHNSRENSNTQAF